MGGLEPLPLTGAKKPLHLPNETLKFYRLGVVIIAPSLDGLFPVAGHGEAVSPMTGTPRVASSDLTRRVASQQSMTGRLMSIRMISGRSLRARSTPCCPSTAKIT